MFKAARNLLRSKTVTTKLKPCIKNDDIIFDHVLVLDRFGKPLGEMPTPAAVQIAKSQGLDLFLIEYDTEPAVCQVTTESQIQRMAPSVNESEGFSFDPTLRPAKIIFSSNVAVEDLERKVDILRKHLLEKKRCEVVIAVKDSVVQDPEETKKLLFKILGEVKDISKPVMSEPVIENGSEFRISVWPCHQEQAQDSGMSRIQIGNMEPLEDHPLPEKGQERKFRKVRSRIDPKIVNLDKHKTPFSPEE